MPEPSDLRKHPLSLDLPGRLGNIDLRPTKVLNPLFEAISNSLHAIEDAKRATGDISIAIIRGENRDLLGNVIEGFHIFDNGVGFTPSNYASFLRSDSTYKHERGGKGVGRLLWLKAFRSVEVDSIFRDADRFWRRRFLFTVPDGVIGDEPEETDADSTSTTVRLSGLLPAFQERCPASAQVIANRIVEHFALAFLGNPPRLELVDGSERISLQQARDSLFTPTGQDTTFTVGAHKFNVRHLRNYGSPERRGHKAFFCVDDRVVRAETIPDLPKGRISDVSTGGAFYYIGLVTGDALKERMNFLRTEITLDDEDEVGIPGILTWPSLLGGVGESVSTFLAPHLNPIRQEARRKVERFVRGKAPQYLPILREPNALENLPSDLSDEGKIDQYLRKIQFRKELELTERAKQLREKVVSAEDFETYKEEVLRFFDEENDYGKSALARYVIHRKVVIELFDKFLGQNVTGEFPLEEVLHKIICPQRITSNDRDYEKHNLWLVDERLSFHSFLASDHTFRESHDRNQQRPDVIVFDVGLAFGDNDPPRSVVMLEFKRPQRDDYTAAPKKNPIDQTLEYVASLREQGWEDSKGRIVRVNPTTQFYCYLICDLMPSLEKEAKKRGWTATPDFEGYYSFNPNFNVYLELISYRKLLRDARMRNAVLFKSLGLD
jgi:hypothetical protein